MTTAEAFAELITHHAIKAGYDLSGPRSGGKKALADDTGISHASICRMLNGQVVPSAYSLERLSDAIDVPVAHLLEAAGIFSPGSLTGGQPIPEPVTVKGVAASLGVRKPLNIKVLEAVTATLLADQEAER